jgi:glycosyltransferase involved in cell wall biosynthesis
VHGQQGLPQNRHALLRLAGMAEFLRLGKAIISLPLSREMPAPVVHGQHAHFIDGSRDSIREAVLDIVADPDYRRHLEHSARAYYEQYLAPERVIARLADAAFSA